MCSHTGSVPPRSGGVHVIQHLPAGEAAGPPRAWRVLFPPFHGLGLLLPSQALCPCKLEKKLFCSWRQKHFPKAAEAWHGEVIFPLYHRANLSLSRAWYPGFLRLWWQLDRCSGFGGKAQEPSWSSASLITVHLLWATLPESFVVLHQI